MRDHRAPAVAVVALAGLMLAGCKLPSLEDGGYPPEPMDADRVPIGQVQGSGDVSPLLDRDVAIEGIVVRNLTGDADDFAQEVGVTLGEGNRGKVVGWFVQDAGDGDPATSDALFVLDQGYDTSLNLPAESEYALRLGSRVRSGDRVKVRGKVVELPRETAADQPHSSGRRVGRGDSAGTVTSIAARSITVLEPRDRKDAIEPEWVPHARADDEASEGMRLQPGRPVPAT